MLRELARTGMLASTARAAAPEQRAALTSAAFALVWPVVFHRVTRPVERRRGHWTCSIAMSRLSDDCVDGFHDDVEAVIDDLLTNAKARITSVEAWICGRLTAATVDGNRRRRGRRGALQRPRMPGWLAAELGRDRWLMELAIRLLEWVGVPDTAGADVWPLESWAVRRAEVTGDWTGSDPHTVTGDVDRVLRAMRRRPAWYTDYVERPLGRKRAPVASSPGDAAGDTRPLMAYGPDDADEAGLHELASTAVDAIAAGVRQGSNLEETVVRVVGTVFGAVPGHRGHDRLPHGAPTPDEQVSALLADSRVVDRIVAQALQILGEE